MKSSKIISKGNKGKIPTIKEVNNRGYVSCGK